MCDCVRQQNLLACYQEFRQRPWLMQISSFFYGPLAIVSIVNYEWLIACFCCQTDEINSCFREGGGCNKTNTPKEKIHNSRPSGKVQLWHSCLASSLSQCPSCMRSWRKRILTNTINNSDYQSHRERRETYGGIVVKTPEGSDSVAVKGAGERFVHLRCDGAMVFMYMLIKWNACRQICSRGVYTEGDVINLVSIGCRSPAQAKVVNNFLFTLHIAAAVKRLRGTISDSVQGRWSAVTSSLTVDCGQWCCTG